MLPTGIMFINRMVFVWRQRAQRGWQMARPNQLNVLHDAVDLSVAATQWSRATRNRPRIGHPWSLPTAPLQPLQRVAKLTLSHIMYPPPPLLLLPSVWCLRIEYLSPQDACDYLAPPTYYILVTCSLRTNNNGFVLRFPFCDALKGKDETRDGRRRVLRGLLHTTCWCCCHSSCLVKQTQQPRVYLLPRHTCDMHTTRR